MYKSSHFLDSIVVTPCRIRKFPGQTEFTMSAEVELISTMVEKKSWTRAPIQMEFQVCDNLNLYIYCVSKCTRVCFNT